MQLYRLFAGLNPERLRKEHIREQSLSPEGTALAYAVALAFAAREAGTRRAGAECFVILLP
jgi:hypothetical protein